MNRKTPSQELSMIDKATVMQVFVGGGFVCNACTLSSAIRDEIELILKPAPSQQEKS